MAAAAVLPDGTRVSERTATVVAIVVAMGVGAVYLYYTLSNASYTLGCDYLTYDAAARRWLAGAAPYDLTITVTGDCGTYQYPPTFLLLILPFTVLSPVAATWAWIAASVACVALAFAIIPVPPVVRIVAFALAATSWPLLFAIKVGAAGPLLLLVFAAAWRWLDDPVRLAGAATLGALSKLQPALLVVWMALTGRWRAAAYSLAAMGAVVLVWFVLSPTTWLDFLSTVRTLQANALEVGANFAPASVALRLGVPREIAQVVGVAHTVAVLILVVLAARQSTAGASLLVAAVASQIVAPVMWDHYAAVVFMPIAWLLARGHRLALMPAVLLNAMFVLLVPPIGYVLILDTVMVAVWLLGRSEAQEQASASISAPAAS